MNEIVFLIEDDPEGGYYARSLHPEVSIFTEAETMEGIKGNIIDALQCHFDNQDEVINYQIGAQHMDDTTEYFKYTRKRKDRKKIKDKWIKFTIKNPEKEEIQKDGRIRKWAQIKDEKKHLRVVLLENGTTIHNAFFDRGFKKENQYENKIF